MAYGRRVYDLKGLLDAVRDSRQSARVPTRLVARALRDSAFEVIFLGLMVTAEQIVQSAVEEDVDLIGLSVFSGGHMTLVPRILHALRDGGVTAVPVVVGGIIPPGDALELKRIGVSQVFGPGCSTSEIISSLRRLVSKQEELGV